MKRSSRIFITLYMIVGILALLALIERVVNGQYQSAIISGLIFAFCAYRAYDTIQKDPGNS